MLQEFISFISLELNRSRKTVVAYEADLRGFNDFLIQSGAPSAGGTGFFVPAAVSAADVRDWLAALSEAGISPVSLRRKLQSLRAFFRFAMKKGVVAKNPAASIALPKSHRHLPRVAGHADISEAIQASSDTLSRLIIEMLYGCGLRRSELIGINDPDINLYTGELKVRGKGSKERILPIAPGLLQLIKDWQAERDALYPDLPSPKPLLAGKRGRLSVSTLYRNVNKALQDTSAEKKSPHTLRHSFATQLLDSGADINSVKELLGHSSLAATQIYTHVSFARLRSDWRQAHPRGHSDDSTTSDKN